MTIKRRDFLAGSASILASTAVSRPGSAAREKVKPHRFIDQDLCLGCGECVPLCPMGAIHLEEKSRVDPEECVECGVCWRSRVCPVEAIQAGKLEWPRVLREVFSNPLAEHESTRVPGRGTEGIKTNDAVERYRQGEMGVFVELGRPVLGARFFDAEKVVMKFTARGYPALPENPVAALIADPATGAFKKEVLNEKALSILIEFILPETAASELLAIAHELAAEVSTVFNLSVALRARPDGSSPLPERFGGETFTLQNGKVNLGLAAGVKRSK